MNENLMQQAPVAISSSGAPGTPPAGAPLIQVLWRRRWAVATSVLVCLFVTGLYLLIASPVYRAAAKVVITQNAPKVFSESSGYQVMSENFTETQRDVFRSASVLSRALQAIDYHRLKTFADISGDPVAALQAGNGFDVEVPSKSDVLTISMESRYPDEAVVFVDGIVRAYTAHQADQERSNGDAMVGVLRKERETLEAKRQAAMQAMVKSQQENGVISFRSNDNGNTVLQRAAALSTALTNAQLTAIELKGELQSIESALKSRASVAAYVQGLQFKSRDTGDREYDELRSQLIQQRLNLATLIDVQGVNHPVVHVQQARVQVLKDQLAEKEQSIALGQLANVTDQLAAAQDREQQLKAALTGQEKAALDMSPQASKFASLEAEVAQCQKLIETLDQRIGQVSADAIDAPPMNVRVLDWAAVEKSPIKPRKGLTLLAALAAGCVLGIGAAMFRDWQDSRVRTPEEALALTGAPVLAMVPRISPELATTSRAQVVHLDPASAAAEAYRSIRTSLSAGAAREAKTILIASPCREDGKSTTAANLAITFAHAGHRTLLLDCDLRQPVQHLVFAPDDAAGVPPGEGLTSALAGEVRISSIIYQTNVPGLCLLPCGPAPANPSELLAGKRFEQLLDSLAGSFDRVVIDSSSLGSVSDARSLAALADATLLVIRMNQSTRTLCAMAMDSLLRVGANVAGIIANDVPMSRGRQEYYGLDGGWRYGAAPQQLPASPRRKLAGGAARASVESGPARRHDVIVSIPEPDFATRHADVPEPQPGANGSTSSGNGH